MLEKGYLKETWSSNFIFYTIKSVHYFTKKFLKVLKSLCQTLDILKISEEVKIQNLKFGDGEKGRDSVLSPKVSTIHTGELTDFFYKLPIPVIGCICIILIAVFNKNESGY